MSQNDERESFEAWFCHEYDVVPTRHSDGDYLMGDTQRQWSAWQARAALANQRAEVPQGGQWLPISTAPKDGTNILLRWGVDGVSQAKFVPGLPHPWKFLDTNDGITWLINHCIDGPGGPSHWMPMPALLAAALPSPPAEQQGSSDVVAFEFYNPATGHAIVDYSVNTHVGTLGAERGYEARPLVYAQQREKVTDGSKPIPLWQAREALDELEASARGDAPFNHHAAAVVRASLESAEQPRQMVALTQQAIVDAFCQHPHPVQFVVAFEQGVRFAERMHGIPAPGGKE